MRKSELRSLKKSIKSSGDKKPKGYFAVIGKLDGTILTGTDSNKIYVTTFAGDTQGSHKYARSQYRRTGCVRGTG